MDSRLAHEVEIEVFCLALEFLEQEIELLGAHELFFARGLMAKAAIEVADVCYFKIYFVKHGVT